MSGSTKKKICWNCEGNVSVHEENCPYCAVYIGPPEPVEEESPLAPPYQISTNDEIPKSPYAPQHQEVSQAYSQEKSSEVKDVAFSFALLSGGVIFLLFGLTLWLFSQSGVLTLSWNSSYWYVWFLLSLPMLYFGWNRVQERE
jgi:hypothetical protein